MKLNLAARLSAGFALAGLLLLASGVAGLQSAHSLTGALQFFTGPVRDTADGATGSRIGTQAEMLAARSVAAGEISPAAGRGQLAEAAALADASIQRVIEGGVIEVAHTEALRRLIENYRAAEARMLETALAYGAAHDRLSREFDSFQQLMSLAEALGEARMEQLRHNTTMAVSWDNGLRERWIAADSINEAKAALLERRYHYQRLVDEDSAADRRALDGALQRLRAGIEAAIALRAFAAGVDAPAWAGKTYADSLPAMLVSHRIEFDAALAALDDSRGARADYARLASELQAGLVALQALGDERAQGHIASAAEAADSAFATIVAAIALGLLATLLAAWLSIRVIARPLRRLAARPQAIDSGEARLDVRLGERGDDELARGFNAFSDSLRQRVGEVGSASR